MVRTLKIDRPTLDDPLYSQKNPHQVFLLVFTLFAMGSLIVTGSSPSQVMDVEVTETANWLWRGMIFFGSLLALVGEFWRGHTWDALAIERAGLLLVGTGSLIYSAVLYTAPQIHDVAYVVGVTSAYGASCLWRCGQITVRLRWIRKVIAEVNEKADDA